MATIQQNLFSWQELDELGDLARLRLVLDNLNDEELMVKLETRRGRGRNDYPIRPLWNSLIAGTVYQHPTIEQLRRELQRNGDLLRLCGFDPNRGRMAVPPAYVFTRFIASLKRDLALVGKMFNRMVRALARELPDFGEHLGIDSKAIDSAAFRAPKNRRPDGRRDTDAKSGAKHIAVKRPDGSTYTREVIWFGYKLHLLVDVTYELPVAYEVTKANVSDTKRLRPLVRRVSATNPELIKRARTLTADRGYDSTENNAKLWDTHGIKPVIGIRHCWQERENDATRLLDPKRGDNVTYDEDGNVYCYDPETGIRRDMAFDGFDGGRNCLKYRCPAAVYGLQCHGADLCGHGRYGVYGRIVRIPLSLDRRVFTPLARSSYAFRREYKKRTAVERINSRLDVSYGFEQHTIRGLKKMHLRCGLALLVMATMALGRIREKQLKELRSLVKLPPAA